MVTVEPTTSPEGLADTRGPIIRSVTWLSAIVPLILVSLRAYTRLFLRKVFGLDDWVIVFALVKTVPRQTPDSFKADPRTNRSSSSAMAPSSKQPCRKVSVITSNGFSPTSLRMPSPSLSSAKSRSRLSSCRAPWARRHSPSV